MVTHRVLKSAWAFAFSDMEKETKVSIEGGGSEPLGDSDKNHIAGMVARWILARIADQRTNDNSQKSTIRSGTHESNERT